LSLLNASFLSGGTKLACQVRETIRLSGCVGGLFPQAANTRYGKEQDTVETIRVKVASF
jgi:hypothetical protein